MPRRSGGSSFQERTRKRRKRVGRRKQQLRDLRANNQGSK